MNKTIIILTIIAALIFLPFFIANIRSEIYDKLFNKTIKIINDFGYIISITAPIRTGKSSLQSGLKHVYEILFIQDILKNLEDIPCKIKTIDFNYVKQFLINNNHPDFDYIFKKIVEKYKLNSNLYYDSLNFYEYKEQIMTYMYCYFAYYIRNNYVASKTKLYSQITSNFNLNYDVETQKIYEKSTEYVTGDYLIELLDELSDEFGAMKWLDDVKDLSGAKEYRRKYGHFHMERNRMISTKQDFTDEVKKNRNLINTDIKITKKVKKINIHPIYTKFLNFIIRIKKFLINIKYKISYLFEFKTKIEREENNYEDYRLVKIYNNEKYKNIINEKNIKIKILESLGFCNFKTSIKNSCETEPRNHNLIIPIKYCFGTYNQYEFRYIQDYLIKNSKSYAVEVFKNTESDKSKLEKLIEEKIDEAKCMKQKKDDEKFIQI